MVGLRGNGGLAEQIAIVETKAPALFTKIFTAYSRINAPSAGNSAAMSDIDAIDQKSSHCSAKDGRISKS